MKTILSDIALPQLPFSENVSVFDTHKLNRQHHVQAAFPAGSNHREHAYSKTI